MPIWAGREHLTDPRSFLLIMILSLGGSGCRSAPQLVRTYPFDPGAGACTTTVDTNGSKGTIRVVREGKLHRALVDLDGDGNPEEQRISHLDDEGRIAMIEVFSSDGNTPRSSETRTWAGRHLVQRQIDRVDAEGRPGPDGTPDEVVDLTWENGVLVRETVDQLTADGLLGVDGTPELVTTWTAANGKHTTGTRIDTRDDAVLRIDRLTWSGDELARQTIDLGGDGEVDTTIVNTWEGGRLTGQSVEGALETTRITYSYCDQVRKGDH